VGTRHVGCPYVQPDRRNTRSSAAGSKVAQDVPPYRWSRVTRARWRWQFNWSRAPWISPATVTGALKTAFRTLFYGKLLRDRAIAQNRRKAGTIPEGAICSDFIANFPREVVAGTVS